jgi:hypothetical protein
VGRTRGTPHLDSAGRALTVASANRSLRNSSTASARSNCWCRAVGGLDAREDVPAVQVAALVAEGFVGVQG